jgi:hypothetical protein
MDIQKTIDKNLQFDKNSRKITGAQIERLESDLQKFGDLSGVVYCQNNKAYVGGNIYRSGQFTRSYTHRYIESRRFLKRGIVDFFI